MKHFLTGLAAVGILSLPAFASAGFPPCQGLTMDQLTGATAIFAGCVVQDKTFTNFTWNSAAVGASSVAVIGDTDPNYPGGSPVNIGVGFSGPFGVPAGGSAIDINISYRVTVTDPNYLIDDASLLLTGIAFHSETSTGSISGSEDWCAGDTLNTGCLAGEHKHADISLTATSGSSFYHVTFSSPVSFVTVSKDIQVNPDPTFATDFSRLDQIYSQTTSLPEPATLSLFGSALVGLGILGRKRFVR